MDLRQLEIAGAIASARAVRLELPLITVEEPQYSEYIQKELDGWEESTRRVVNSWLKNQLHVNDLRELLINDPFISSLFCYSSTATIYLKQSSIRMSELAPMLRKLASKGFRQNKPMKLSSNSPERTIYLKRGEYDVIITFSMSLGEGGCQLIQEGTETIEKPIYKMVCPDETLEKGINP